ncbi:MAG: hypothetical protein JAY85_13435 [Candidatus Thiodiazotropha weberae]|nr:hypothetical protein [Candidatus Thiodiazotropha endoloripes]MCG7899445.1 hypothetical protein [Candidatus Thiodiazotropha weberae]MCG7915540.1 hypothetical protein [Candidatus Thiodiazotropha weberae]
MKYLIHKACGLLLILLMSPSVSMADSWSCHYQELTRSVVILYPNEPSRLPCKVYYAKPKENVIPRTLWEAQNEENYCQRKAEAFVDKLESWGWQCALDNDS